MEKAVKIIIRSLGQVYPTGFYLYYTIAALAFLAFRRRAEQKRRLLGVYSLLVFCAILMPPFTLAVWRFMRNGGVYWRLMWLVPYAILIACVGTELIFKPGRILLRTATAAVIAAALIFGGTNVYTAGVFEKPTSRDKLPQITLTVMSVINENAKKTGNPYKRLCAPTEIFCQIRQVDATILQSGSRVLQVDKLKGKTQTEYLFQIMNGIAPDSKRKIAKYMRYNEMNYIVFPKSYKFMRTLTHAQAEKIYDQDGWQIWYNPHITNTKHAGEYDSWMK